MSEAILRHRLLPHSYRHRYLIHSVVASSFHACATSFSSPCCLILALIIGVFQKMSSTFCVSIVRSLIHIHLFFLLTTLWTGCSDEVWAVACFSDSISRNFRDFFFVASASVCVRACVPVSTSDYGKPKRYGQKLESICTGSAPDHHLFPRDHDARDRQSEVRLPKACNVAILVGVVFVVVEFFV